MLDLSASPPRQALNSSMVSRRLTEVPIEFHCGVVTFGVVRLSLPLVSVKLASMWVSSTQCFGGIKIMAKISLSVHIIFFFFLLFSKHFIITPLLLYPLIILTGLFMASAKIGKKDGPLPSMLFL